MVFVMNIKEAQGFYVSSDCMVFKVAPAHFDTAYVRVEVKQGPDAYGESHYFIELRPFGWIQIEHVEN